MLAAAARFLPATRSFVRQIIPPVIATLIAAVLIAGYNRAFSGHLTQPRLAVMQGEASVAPVPPGTVTVAKTPRETAADPVIETSIITEHPVLPDRVFAKDEDREAGKDQTASKIATPAEPAAPAVTRSAARKPEPQAVEQRPAEPRASAAPGMRPAIAAAPVAPIAVAPVAPAAPVMPMIVGQPAGQPIAQEPPPIITAKPIVTVPDRQRPPYEPQYAEQEAAPRPRQNVLGTVVETLRPSSIFARMRELGDRIEAAGNDILPSIRQ